jgi:hypothetical protein
MNRSELSAHGSEWTIPAARYKTKLDHLIPLSKFAQAVLAEVPIIGTKGWVFTTDGTVPISGFSKFKKAFDAKVLAELRKHDPEAKPLWTAFFASEKRWYRGVIGSIRSAKERKRFEGIDHATLSAPLAVWRSAGDQAIAVSHRTK